MRAGWLMPRRPRLRGLASSVPPSLRRCSVDAVRSHGCSVPLAFCTRRGTHDRPRVFLNTVYSDRRDTCPPAPAPAPALRAALCCLFAACVCLLCASCGDSSTREEGGTLAPSPLEVVDGLS